MKIIHVNTYSTFGGATRACVRLHEAFLAAGHDSSVRYHFGDPEQPEFIGPRSLLTKRWARFRTGLDLKPLYQYPRRLNPGWSFNRIPSLWPERINWHRPDIVMLHGLAGGMISISDLQRIRAPLVWLMHDQLPFTGGCHYTDTCLRYEESCGHCPQLRSGVEQDLTRTTWLKKKRAWKNLDLALVSPSHWLADCARSSSLFRNKPVEVIPYALNLQVYHPVETGEARKILGLPFDKKIILCGAVDLTESPRKGFPHLLNALRWLQTRGDLKRHNISLAVFAREMPLLPGLEELPIHFLGTFSRDEDLVQAYAAADLFVAPSIQDNLPNTVLESMACGTPVAAFRLGGFPDMIDHRVTGWLAEPLNDVDLAEGILWSLVQAEPQSLRLASRAKALATFSPEKIVAHYTDLFRKIRQVA